MVNLSNQDEGTTSQSNPSDSGRPTDQNAAVDEWAEENRSSSSTPNSTRGKEGVICFECNICLELAHDPVVTLCGHLFCWPCLYTWMQVQSALSKECPVCKSSIEQEKIIPLYGRGNTKSKDRFPLHPDILIPGRPAGQRFEAPDVQNDEEEEEAEWPLGYEVGFITGTAGPSATARFGNVTLSAGIGVLPSIFRLQVHGGWEPGLRLGVGARGIRELRINHPPLMPPDPAAFSKLLLFLGSVLVFSLLLNVI